jgi:hypothetical protein
MRVRAALSNSLVTLARLLEPTGGKSLRGILVGAIFRFIARARRSHHSQFHNADSNYTPTAAALIAIYSEF